MKSLKNKWLVALACLLYLSALSPAHAQIVDPDQQTTKFVDPEQQDSTQSTIAKLYQDVEIMKKLKVSGYMQAEYQVADSSGIKSFAGGDFPTYEDKRFLLRRARLKIAWYNIHSSYVFQIDAVENGVPSLKDAYFKYTDPYLELFSITAGVFNRSFGYEIGYSSSDREAPERGRMSQIIFPNERDLGFMVTVQAPKTSRWSFLKLDAGLVSGTGVGAKEFDKKKDFVSHLSINKSSNNEKIKIGLGASLYDGGFVLINDTVYTMNIVNDTTKFIVENDKIGDFSKRTYYGLDAQVSIDWVGGITTIRAEYIAGTQPSTATDSKSISVPIYGADGKTGVGAYAYNRKFNGAYFYFLQNIGQSKAQLVVKYDWYDPNTEVSGNQIGITGTKTSSADVKFTTLGLGAIWRFDQNMKFMAYYDIVKNESTQLKGFTQDIKDNVLTLRLQYRF